MVSRRVLLSLAVLVFILSLLSILFTFVLSFQKPAIIDKRVYYARIQISDIYGVDVNSTALIFGSIPPGTLSRRYLDINNTYDFSLEVQVNPLGDMAKFIDRRRVIIGPRLFERIEIEAVSPEGMPHGTYEGTVEVIFFKEKSS